MKSRVFAFGSLVLLAVTEASKSCDGLGNNLQRCFTSSSVLASAYCSSYLGIPLVTHITTPSTSKTVTTVVSTEVDVLSSTSTSVTTSFATVTTIQTTTSLTTTTTTSSPDEGFFKKRKVTPTAPACVTNTPAASISSACSCLGITPSTIISTAATSTKTVYVSETTTTLTTSTVIAVATLAATVTTTSQETDTSTTTSTTVGSCVPSQTVISNWEYVQFYAGYGMTENPDNPANDSGEFSSALLPGSFDACRAVNLCAESSELNGDLSFNVYFILDEDVWQCVSYAGYDSSAAYVNVNDPGVGASYAYQYPS